MSAASWAFPREEDARRPMEIGVFWDAHAHRRIAELAAAAASIKEM